MDSLTQLALGAAVGEAVAGRKMGNKAMIWGALAGTIPDLDVVSGLWMNDIESMAFHRGISHSILFCIVAPFVFAWFGKWFYQNHGARNIFYERFWQVVWIILSVTMILGFGYLSVTNSNVLTILLFVIAGVLGFLWIKRSFLIPYDDYEPISYKQWYVLFFLGFVTHVMIDAFTTYGTQIFQPFSNLRFTTSTISVADPAYTVPLLGFLLLASFYPRTDVWRSRLNTIGLVLSSAYMVFTFVNKAHVDRQFKARLDELNVPVKRYMTNPSILNNILWHGIAETDTGYVDAYYSLFDRAKPFRDVRIFSKNRDLITSTSCNDSWTLNTLRWFSDGYYNYTERDGKLYYNDLRFGTIWLDEEGTKERNVFYFQIDDACDAHEIRDTDDIGDAWKVFVNRLKGID